MEAGEPGVLAGFFVAWFIVLVGMFVGRRNIPGHNARSVLSSLAFFGPGTALLFGTPSNAGPAAVFAAPLVRADAALTTVVLSFGAVRFLLIRSAPEPRRHSPLPFL
ncbi:hypothetical protein [Arthrobacter oryzae]|uniref:Uncharacterized protein n=1 Tax=Arthrobacter oryzae TaxID=409290 RepID=A0A3N0C9E5_9MICC|nr:hypothetical protein [Arthrobacter oryzae]RNL60094.1 hypothetical protein D7003_01790 [Arthrobacter oryzae]